MKKNILLIIILLLFLFTFIISVKNTSTDSIFNIKSDLSEMYYDVNDIDMVNWNGEEKNFLSGEDPMIIINHIDKYIHDVKIKGSFIEDSGEIQFFYTSNSNEQFSEEKSVYVPYFINGDSVTFYVDKNVYSLRIDLVPHYGTELYFNGIKINDKSLVFSITDIAKNCILPTCLIGFVLFVMLFGRNILPYVITFKKFTPLIKNLISRDLKVKYRRSILGFMWSILNPLLMALVINAIFSTFFRFQVEYFATYYLVGALIFNFISEATSASMTSVLYAAPLIKKVYIPKYVFPLEKCVFAFINMLFSCVAVIVVMIIQKVPFQPTIFLAFIPMIYAFIFAFGLGLILSTIAVFFRDIEHLYSIWLTIWMYLTPIIYPEELLVTNGLMIVMKLNPMYYFVHFIRNVAMYGIVPSYSEHAVCIMFSLSFLFLGIGVFKTQQDKFILQI